MKQKKPAIILFFMSLVLLIGAFVLEIATKNAAYYVLILLFALIFGFAVSALSKGLRG